MRRDADPGLRVPCRDGVSHRRRIDVRGTVCAPEAAHPALHTWAGSPRRHTCVCAPKSSHLSVHTCLSTSGVNPSFCALCPHTWECLRVCASGACTPVRAHLGATGGA